MPENKELSCPVHLTLNIDEDKVIEVRGAHSHDNNLLKNEVAKLVKETISNLSEQPYVTPRAARQDLSQKILANEQLSSGLSYVPSLNTISKSLVG